MMVNWWVRGRAVLVGSAGRLEVIYPFGIERLLRGAVLEGDLADATLTTSTRVRDLGLFGKSELRVFRVAAAAGELEFSLRPGAATVFGTQATLDRAAERLLDRLEHRCLTESNRT